MTLGSLTVREVWIDRFGGLADHCVMLPDHPFVVVHGANEAGKSTLTECISWLLAGPGGDAANAQRFGNPRDRIGGRLTGSVRGRTFVATGSFEVLQRGAPNESGLTVELDGPLTAPDWRAALGGVDPAVLAAVYRLWGEQLHDGDGVEGHLSRIALAGLSGLTDPRELVTELSDHTTRLMRARGADADSILLTSRHLDDLRAQRRVAGSTADEHLRVQHELADLRTERDRWESERAHHAAEAATVATVLGVAGHQRELAALCGQLAALPEVPDGWTTLVADPAAVDAAVAALDQATTVASRADRELEQAAIHVTVPTERLHELSLSDADLADATRIATEHRSARAARDAARLELDAADGHAATARAATDQLLGSGADGPADRRVLDRAALSPIVAGQLTRHLDHWAERARDADGADHRRALAESEANGAAERARLAREAWDRFGTGTSPEAWMQRRTAPSSTTPPPSAMRLSLPAVVALVAVVAAVVGEWVSAGVAAVAAVAVAIAVLRPPSSVVTEPDEAALERTFATAQEVLDAERLLTDREATAARERDVAARAVEDVSERANAADRAFSDAGLPVPADPDHGARILALWTQATAAHAAERHHVELVDAARRALDAADRSVQRTETDGADLLDRWGVPTGTPPHALEELVTSLRAASSAARIATEARRELERARSTVDQLLAPVADEVAGQRPARVVERVRELADIDAQRRDLERRFDERRRDRDARLGDDPNVRAVFERDLPVHELERLAAVNEQAADEAAERSRTHSEHIGRLETRLEELAATERIAELELRIGSEQEHLVDLAAEAAANAIAARLLRDVAEEYERANQPAMVARATELVRSVAPEWAHIVVRPAASSDGLQVVIRRHDGVEVEARRLSTGARALLYLAFRISLTEHDAERRGLRLPLLCDDPLVHLDDRRAREVVPLLATAAANGHQVLLFTCHDRTVAAAVGAGAEVVHLDG